MNDFTKEELQLIIMWGELYKYGAGISWPKLCSRKNHDNLLNKIQTMLDNYCDHNRIGFLGDIYGYDCKDCGAYIHSNEVTDEQHEAALYE